MKFSLILPAYNEEARLPGTLGNLAAFQWPQGVIPEVMVVCDGCTDNTAGVARGFRGVIPNLKVLELPRNQGKGGAVAAGMVSAGGDWLLFTDADESYPFAHHLPLMIQAARQQPQADVFIGCRAHPESVSDEAHPPLLRRLMSATYSRLTHLLLYQGLPDSQAGLKMFRRNAAHLLFPQITITGFGFDTELLYLAQKGGFVIHRLPVQVRHMPESSVRPIPDSLSMVANLFTIRKRHRAPLAKPQGQPVALAAEFPSVVKQA